MIFFRGQTGEKSLIRNWGSHDYLEFSIIIPNFELFQNKHSYDNGDVIDN